MRTASTDSLSPEEQHELEVRGASRAYRYQDYPMIPETRPWSKWWEFVTCSGSFGRFEVGTERVTKRCAVSSGLYLDMDWSCIEGERGVELLKESVRATEELGIR